MTEIQETVMMAEEYTNEKKNKVAKITIIYYIIGLTGPIVHEIIMFSGIKDTF